MPKVPRYCSARLTPTLPSPILVTSPKNQDLSLSSTVRDLPLHNFAVETSHRGRDIATIFDKYPLLPGVILLENSKFLGMISRRRFLEYLLHPQGWKLFLKKPLRVLYSYAQIKNLIVLDTTTILATSQLALRRSPELLGEPIVIQISPPEDSGNSAPINSQDTYYLLDLQELYLADWQIRGIEAQVRYEQNQSQMIQIEKMASLGRLVDGVAHEILDPVNFIWGNLNYIHLYTEQLLELIKAYDMEFMNSPLVMDKSTIITDLKNSIEFDFLQADLPRTVSSIKTGAERLKKLVTSLQNFCHLDDVYPKPADLHQCLDSILTLLKSRLQKDIEIITNYGYLPPVTCFVGQLNQVFINILGNAVDVLLNNNLDRYSSDPQLVRIKSPAITITTNVYAGKQIQAEIANSRWVSICIAHNGLALSPSGKQKLLDSFSGDRRFLKETSWALTYWIVTGKHGGILKLRSPLPEIFLNSEIPLGTEFEIFLPLV